MRAALFAFWGWDSFVGERLHRWVPFEVVEKADPDGKVRLKVRGIVSTEHVDRQGDQILQDGIDFAPLVKYGWLNDNHSKATTGVLGYPDRIYPVNLPGGPGGKPVRATAIEAYLLDTPEAHKVAELARSLKGTPRQLGFSVEGDILGRSKRNPKLVTRAEVRNIAITNCPVNPYTRLDLVKSMDALSIFDSLEKAASVGHSVAVQGIAVAGNLRPVVPRSLSLRIALPTAAPARRQAEAFVDMAEEWRLANGLLMKSQAEAMVRSRFPRATPAEVERILRLSSRPQRSTR